MEYSHQEIEDKWKKYWKKNNIYVVTEDADKPKYYVLDMFPYPSGSGLHVGHPLGYIASDILSRFMRMNGYNVLHPMGFDAFGLPAEQYAIQTGQSPWVTTKDNIAVYKKQLENIGLSFDWSRQVITADPDYYKWTQTIFLKLYHSWFDQKEQKSKDIEELVQILNQEGNTQHPVPQTGQVITKDEWLSKNESEKEKFLMEYRLAYLSYAEVNWCEELGTVLANDEVINGRSERGGYPVVKRNMRQWFLRITQFADRLLEGLEKLDWPSSMKEIQKNWIGKSHGADIVFSVENSETEIAVFTTRPDTIFGVSFLVVAPENKWVDAVTTPEQMEEIEKYKSYVATRSDLERMAEADKITGAFTGAYALHPFTGEKLPIWTSEYVLDGYGTGAIMAVPAGDSRDHKFAKHFDLPFPNIFGESYNGEEAVEIKEVLLTNSDFLDGMDPKTATPIVLSRLEKEGKGTPKVNYRFHDAGFSRQRYWGEPFPISYRIKGEEDAQFENEQEEDIEDIPIPMSLEDLPLELPTEVSYESRKDGRSPLASNADWVARNLETDTMPGYAGSSWYFLRYADPHNKKEFASKEKLEYWQNVDVYFGGAEHAVGHMFYARMWTMVLFDLGLIPFEEPFQKLVNQGMIQGQSKIAYRKKGTQEFVTAGLAPNFDTDPIHVDVNIVDGEELDMDAFRKWRPDFTDATFVTAEDGKFYCHTQVEKMSKRYYNVVNPDDVIAEYGADVFRLYEMFLGPINDSKPWDTQGIEGVSRFIKKLWRLCLDEEGQPKILDGEMNAEEEKLLHQTIKKISEDIKSYSFNTSVSQFMITVNQLQKWGGVKRDFLENLVLCMAPFTPFIAEEIYQNILGHKESVVLGSFPLYDESKLVESTKTYPIAINGKPRTELELSLDLDEEAIQKIVMENEVVQKWLEGKQLRKFVFVPGRMINLVIG